MENGDLSLDVMPACHNRIAQLAEEVTAEGEAAVGDTQAVTSGREPLASGVCSRQKQLQGISKASFNYDHGLSTAAQIAGQCKVEQHIHACRSAGGTLQPLHCTRSTQVLFEKHKFRQKPFEWVYDGLSPVMLQDVLESHSGLSVILATIYVCLAACVGNHLVIAPVPKTANAASLAGAIAVRTAAVQCRTVCSLMMCVHHAKCKCTGRTLVACGSQAPWSRGQQFQPQPRHHLTGWCTRRVMLAPVSSQA